MMKKFTQHLLVFTLLIISGSAFGQTVVMGSGMEFPPNSPADCNIYNGVSTNFVDDGGAGGNYSANFNDTIVVCPDLSLGTKMGVTFGINAGYTFDVHGSDSIYVYDGPTTSAPLLGVHNSATNPTGFGYTATWGNPSGCLTIVFVSDGANEGTGWQASLECGNAQQPFEMHMEAFVNGDINNAISPIDTGYVDVCLGDSILLVAKPVFPNSLEATGYGYSQTLDNVVYDWNISDGGTYPNNDSIWFVPPTRNGFIVDLKITDLFPAVERLVSKVRVSQLPIFQGTGPIEDTICLGSEASLLGGFTPTDTVGVLFPPGSFQLGGSFAGLTYLPDGSGVIYTTSINMSGFPTGAVIDDAQDLNQVCLTMEHSYTGDLEIWLECPPVAPATTGQIVALLNSYSPGSLPGGTSGGGTFLGHPLDNNSATPGVGWEYCFSSVFNSIGPMTSNWGNTVPVAYQAGPPELSAGISMDPADVYAPETSFGTALAGCPLNGDWKIHVKDNIGQDNGYIFEWGLFFDPSFFPGMGNYSNNPVQTYWSPDPTIDLATSNDTLSIAIPTQVGNHAYTYNLIDDFGCHYDTTVNVFTLPLPNIFNDTIACDMTFQVAGTQAYQGGTWFSTPSGLNFNTASSNNPVITSTSAGTYQVSFVDNACQDTVSSQIVFVPYPVIFDDTLLCADQYQVTGTQVYTGGGVWSALSPEVIFLPNNTTTNPIITATTSGQYQVTYTDNVCNNSTSSMVTLFLLPHIFPDTSACDYIYNVQGTVAANGGVWSSADTNIRFLPSPNVLNPTITSSIPGTFEVTFTDDICNTEVTSQIEFINWAYVTTVDTVICMGSTIMTACGVYPQNDTYVWSTGTLGHDITVGPGVYTVTASNECNSHSSTMTIGAKVCYINAPNIITLSSTVGNNKFILTYDGVEEFHISIVNRWGGLVAEYDDPSPSAAWDGRNLNGEVVSEGTYFYKFTAKLMTGEEIEQQGFVQVIH